MVLTLAFTVVVTVQQPGQPGDCVAGSDPATVEICIADEETKRGGAATGSERRRRFEAAAGHLRKATYIGDTELRISAFRKLAAVYDADRLDHPQERETVLRELIALVPQDPRFSFQLARLQERGGFFDAAEETLLAVRHRLPHEIDTYRQLAQYYARRVTGLDSTAREQTPREPPVVGEPDQDGIYRVGGQLPPPARAGVPKFPIEAQSAGIAGAVEAEIVVDATGAVTEARVVKSVPLLDEAALDAVRQWRYEPTIVKGQAVPVRMTVTVNFSLSGPPKR